MQDRFDKFFEYILLVEGAYTNNPKDRGGETKYGITKAVAKKHGYDVKVLTKDQAKEIYYTDYFLKFHIDKIQSNKIALSVLDWCVNSGYRGTKKIQQALNMLGNKLVIDGILGAKSLEAINKANPDKLLPIYHDLQRVFYNRIVKARPDQIIFLKGWLNRVGIKERTLKTIQD